MKNLVIVGSARTYGVADEILTREKRHSHWSEVKILFLPDVDVAFPFQVVAKRRA